MHSLCSYYCLLWIIQIWLLLYSPAEVIPAGEGSTIYSFSRYTTSLLHGTSALEFPLGDPDTRGTTTKTQTSMPLVSLFGPPWRRSTEWSPTTFSIPQWTSSSAGLPWSWGDSRRHKCTSCLARSILSGHPPPKRRGQCRSLWGRITHAWTSVFIVVRCPRCHPECIPPRLSDQSGYSGTYIDDVYCDHSGVRMLLADVLAPTARSSPKIEDFLVGFQETVL